MLAVWTEAMVMLHPLCVTQLYRLPSMAAWIHSTGVSATISSLMAPRSISLQSVAALVLGLLHNPYTPAPSSCAFQGTCMPVQGLHVCVKDCLILIPLGLPQIRWFTLSFQCFSSDPDNCPSVGMGPLLPVLLTLPLFPLLCPTEFCMVL